VAVVHNYSGFPSTLSDRICRAAADNIIGAGLGSFEKNTERNEPVSSNAGSLGDETSGCSASGGGCVPGEDCGAANDICDSGANYGSKLMNGNL